MKHLHILRLCFAFCIVPSGPALGVNVTIVSFQEVIIRWSAPNVTEQNGILTSYVINITLISTGQTFSRTSSNTSLNLDGLLPFTSYTCRVAARTQVGTGPFSISNSFLTDEIGKVKW